MVHRMQNVKPVPVTKGLYYCNMREYGGRGNPIATKLSYTVTIKKTTLPGYYTQ